MSDREDELLVPPVSAPPAPVSEPADLEQSSPSPRPGARCRRGRADERPGDPFEGWPSRRVAAVIEDSPADASVEHVRGEIDVPDGYTVFEGTPIGNRRTVAIVVSRFNGGADEPDAPRRARHARSRPGCRRTRSPSCPCPARSSCRSPRWRSRRRGATRASSRSARSCAARRRTSSTSPSEAASGLQLAAIETGVPVAFGVLTVDTVAQGRRGSRAADAVRTRARDGRHVRAAEGERPAGASRQLHWPADVQGLRQSAARSPRSGTTARTRWWRRSAASTRISSASACC